jgi:hypothetical protein
MIAVVELSSVAENMVGKEFFLCDILVYACQVIHDCNNAAT